MVYKGEVMSEKLSAPQGVVKDILSKRSVHIGRIREQHPAIGQPKQDTIPGPGSSDTN